jgi:prolyl 4-hydroxylase
MEHFVRTEKNSIPAAVCDSLIELHRSHHNFHIRYEYGHSPQMTQLDLTMNRELFPELHREICNLALRSLDHYKKAVPETKFWPRKMTFENFRIKHYAEGGGDRFDEHIDAADLETSKRYIAFFWYLNDVPEGGETVITNFDMVIKPEKGKLFMFPPLWLYPHKGNPVKRGEKFLLSSYLHFNHTTWDSPPEHDRPYI